MMTDTTRWSQAYLAELDRAAAHLPADRRAELLEQIGAHLAAELPATATADQAHLVLSRLGEPAELVAEAAADLPPGPAAAGPSAAEILALLLMGIGGVALPLIAPAVGVLLMRSTPRWMPQEVRRTWLILAVGLVALAVLIGLATIPNPPAAAAMAALAMLGIMVVVGPLSALYAATRPRP
jgi:hypothetical protein